MSLGDQLSSGLEVLDLPLDAGNQATLLAYLELLVKWNRIHNLTAVRDPEQMVVLHLLDSLSLLPHLADRTTLLDVGSGAGLPGIPLAIAKADLQVTLLDSSHKKTAFLHQVQAELALTNCSVVCARVEAWQPQRTFDVVVSRAFADLADFASQARHLVAPGGELLAMKGVYPHEEIAGLPPDCSVARVVELQVPTLGAKRHLVAIATRYR
jgi:16S rRNA (guanine527-N7)-methyltransferase